MSGLYEIDGYTWALTQAELLRRRSGNELDWDNLAEEIESLGKRDAAELRSRFITLLAHLLKWKFQAERRSRSWAITIRRERQEIARHLGENPGLKGRAEELYAAAYAGARLDAIGETDLPEEVFPLESPFARAEALDEDYWPEP